MRDPNRPQPIVPEGFIPGLSKARETILGPLMPWFGPRAIRFVEGFNGGKYGAVLPGATDGQTYANDQLDRFLRGAKLDPDVKILDLDNEPVARGPKEAQPTSGADYASPADWEKDEPADPEPDEKYEPVGTRAIVGDRVYDTKDGELMGVVKELGERRGGPALFYEDRGFDSQRMFDEGDGRWRVLKRPDAEAWAGRTAHSQTRLRRLKVGDKYFAEGLLGMPWHKTSEKDHHINTVKHCDLQKYEHQPPEVAAKWLAEVKEAGLL